MAIAVPKQMFLNAIDFLKGWPSPHAVDAVGKLSANVTVPEYAFSGRVVHFNASKEFELGAQGNQMAIFLIPSSTDFDVANPGNGQTDPYGWNAIAPAGNMSGLVACGGYELATTEYDKTVGVTYNPNDWLHAPTEAQVTTGTDKTMAGKLYKTKTWPGGAGGAFTISVDNVCGVVSRGAAPNHFRVPTLAFWPVYLPSPTN